MKVKVKIKLITILFFALVLIFSLFNIVNAQTWDDERSLKFSSNGILHIYYANAQNNGDLQFKISDMTANIFSIPMSSEILTGANAYCLQHGINIMPTTYQVKAQIDIYAHGGMINDVDVGYKGDFSYSFPPSQYIAYVLAHGATYKRIHDTDRTQHIVWQDFEWFLEQSRSKGYYKGKQISSQKVDGTTNYDEYKKADAFYDYKVAYKTPSVVSTSIGIDLSTNPDYCFIGPLKIKYTEGSYNGAMFGGPRSDRMAVYDRSGNVIEWSTYWKIVDSPSSNKELEYPKSNTNFYLRIKKSAFTGDSPKNGVGKITFGMRDMVAKANFYTVYGVSEPSAQKWMFVESASTSYEESTLTLNINKEIKVEGGVELTKVDSGNNTKLQGFGFRLYNKDSKKWVKRSNDKISYVTSETSASTFTTGKEGTFKVTGLIPGDYQVKEVSVGDNDGYLVPEGNKAYKNFEIKAGETATVTFSNTYQKGNFELEKVDASNESIKLDGVEFTLKCTRGSQEGKYVGLSSGKPYYSTSKVTLKTDSKGKISITGMWTGTYELKEEKNPHYGYATAATATITISSRGNTSKKIKNTRKYVKLLGYVWEDKQYDDGKNTLRNDLYKDNSLDKNDSRISGITVTLVDANNTEIKKTTTNANGEYQFVDVEASKLSTYSVRFYYDGLLYEAVATNLNKNNGSKAAEGTRQQFNNRFASVERGNSNSQAAALNSNNGQEARINYEFEQKNDGRKAKIESTENCTMTASTGKAGYKIPFDLVELEKNDGKIENINLGIYERPQTDLATKKELEQVKVEVAGYGHIYKYGPVYDENDKEETEDSWDIGVRFESRFKTIYKRPIYKADLEYETTNKSDMLNVSLTYKITIANQSTLPTRVNQIADYFDARYEIIGVGTGIDKTDGSLTGEFRTSQYREVTSNSSKYGKVEIDLDMLIQPLSSNTSTNQTAIYIQFDLSRENIREMLNEGIYDDVGASFENKLQNLDRQEKTLRNVAEVTSFTTYSDKAGKTLYAAVDKDSVPGNCTIGDEKTYEDDTDKASTLALVIANEREVSGKIFEDLQDENLSKTKNISEGNSIYDQRIEKAIGGVDVELVDEAGNSIQTYDETTKQWKSSRVTVGTDGTYKISGLIPGKYKIKFIWGNGTYKIVNGTKDEYEYMIENYKSTVIDKSLYEEIDDDPYFYKKIEEKSRQNNSFAIDDTGKRKIIDEAYKKYNFESATSETTMESYTPTLEINVEYRDEDDMVIDSEIITGKTIFEIKNINLGIIRRPEQSIDLIKSISRVRFTLPNGQVLIDATINEDGELEGQKTYVTYLPQKVQNGKVTEKGLIRIEMDSSLLQGSTIEISYRLDVVNTSQTDYLDINYGYYKFGESYYEGRQSFKVYDVVTISPTAILDYMDLNIVFDPDNSTNIAYEWRPITISELDGQEGGSKVVNSNVIAALKGNSYTRPDGTSAVPIDQSQIFITNYFKTKDIKFKPEYLLGNTLNPADSRDIYIVGAQVINEEEDSNFVNQAEIVEVEKENGGKPNWIPGNYVPNGSDQESDDAASQEVAIVPSTGENRNYVFPVGIIVVSFLLLGVGVCLIIAKILKKDFK